MNTARSLATLSREGGTRRGGPAAGAATGGVAVVVACGALVHDVETRAANSTPVAQATVVFILSGIARSGRGSADLDERSIPRRFVGLGFVELVEIDVNAIGVLDDGEPAHVARGPAAVGNIRPIGLKARMVLGALEFVITLVPLQRGVLVRAGEIECVEHALPPDENHVVGLVDLR